RSRFLAAPAISGTIRSNGSIAMSVFARFTREPATSSAWSLPGAYRRLRPHPCPFFWTEKGTHAKLRVFRVSLHNNRRCAASLHEPAMADHERLAGQRVRAEGGEEERGFCDVLDRGELAVDGVLQHDVLDDVLLGDAELLRLLRNLLVDERRAHEARADDVGADAVLGAFLGDGLGETDEAVLGRHIGSLEHRGFFRVHRAHVDDASAALLVHLLSAARVVRKAPSRWMASSCFHLAKGNSSSGATIWTPALLTRMSRRPKVLITFAMPVSTCSSDVTSIATPRARRSEPASSAAVVQIGDGEPSPPP